MTNVFCKIWVSAKLLKPVWKSANFPKISQKFCSNALKNLSKFTERLPYCLQENAQTSLTHNQVYIHGEF